MIHTCTEDTAKQLKYLRVPQNSMFKFTEDDQPIALFTSSELGMMLPTHVKIRGEMKPVGFQRADNQWRCRIKGVKQCGSTNEAESRAKMLIYLLEQGLHDVDMI